MLYLSFAKKTVAGLLCLFIPLFLLSQNNTKLQGRIIDSVTKKPLIGATIVDLSTHQGTTSSANGLFELTELKLPTELMVSYVGYDDYSFSVDKSIIDLIIELSPGTTDLKQVEITALRPTIRITTEQRSVIDFEIVDGKILLITTTNRTRKERIELRDLEGDLLDSFGLEHLPGQKSLHKSCLGNVHLLYKENEVFALPIFKDVVLGLAKPIPYSEYEIEVMSCQLAHPDYLYYRFDQFSGQMANFRGFNVHDKSSFLLTTVQDEDNIARFFEEIYPLMKRDKEVPSASVESVEELQQLRNQQEKIDGWMNMFYQKLNLGLGIHAKGDTLILFDHFHGHLKLFTVQGGGLNEIPIEYHTDRKWLKEVLSDKPAKRFYVLIEDRKGYVAHEINLESGASVPVVYFKSQFGKNFRVHDGVLYYMEKAVNPSFKMNYVLRKIKL